MVKKLRFFYLFSLTLFKKKRKNFTIFALILIFAISAVLSFDRVFSDFFAKTTGKIIKPMYVEAIVGKLETFNPLFSKAEYEKEINSLVFRGLVKVLPTGEVSPDLAEKYESKNDTEFTFYLKKNIHWQDGKKFTADDVIYTIQLGQNSLYQSEIQETFKDVEAIKKNDYQVIFRLKEPFSPFLSALTIGIIPKHISLNNYRPIGTGDFRFIEIKKDYAILEGKNIRLRFNYYPNFASAETAVKLGQAHALSNLRPGDLKLSSWSNFQIKQTTNTYREVMIFLNNREEVLSEKNLRQALAYATPKAEILKTNSGQKGVMAYNSLPNIASFQTNAKEKYNFDIDKANSILSASGWVLKDGLRQKNGKNLNLTITTIADPEFEDTAIKLRDSWTKLGAQVAVELVSGSELKNQIVQKRSFSVLLTSQLLNSDPDQYVLWHTTQAKESNISAIASAKLDKLLEDGRKTSDTKIRTEKYQEFTRILLDESPAIFLYYPNYNWLVSKRISNIDLASFRAPEDRFKSIESWSIKKPLF